MPAVAELPRALRTLPCLLWLACLASLVLPAPGTAATPEAPFRVRVAVLVNFEIGADTGDEPGEFQYWRERGLGGGALDECLAMPYSTHEACIDRDSGLLVTYTGLTQDRAAASVMALGLDPRLDFSRAYWIIGGIAGIDPADGTLGSAAWGRYVVNGDWAHEIDAREMPSDWPTGYLPFKRSEPYAEPVGNDHGKVFALNGDLARWAFETTRDLELTDSEGAATLRAAYTGYPAALAGPRVMLGDNLSASTFWHGELLNEWANDWVSYWTGGDGEFVTTAVEDSGILEALRFLDGGGRADFDRVMLLRTASNFSMQPPGLTAAESLTRESEGFGGMGPAIAAHWQVGSTVARALISDWERYGDAIPAAPAARYDTIIANGLIVDGSGGEPYRGDVALRGDRIAALGDLDESRAAQVIDASGKAVSPGFINMMAWSVIDLIKDGRGMSDLTQGITLEVFGEGNSMGPLTPAMKADFPKYWDGIEAEWTTLGEYLEFLADRGVSPNVASFIGATTPRAYVLGMDDVDPTPAQLEAMQDLVRDAMREGALGVASSLIYTPGNFAETDELIALAEAAGEYGGIYASHVRNEGKGVFGAVEELITIAREAAVPAEIYHLKMAHPLVWGRFDELVDRIETARANGLRITADVYPYPAGATGLDAIMPPWANEGGLDAWIERMQDPATRDRLRAAMREDSEVWENMLTGAGPEAILLTGFRTEALQRYVGMTLAEVAEARGTSPEDTAMDLVIADRSRVDAVFFTQSEDVVRKAVALPWTSFCTDAGAPAAEGEFLRNSTHPRAYGTFPRVLGHYVREEGLLSLAEAVRKASGLPAENLSLVDRGRLEVGYYADVVVFDPTTIIDRATFEDPHRYSVGVEQVFVNGEHVIADGDHTGATPGRVVRGPGWIGRDSTQVQVARPAAR